jgi:hypothetical protein
MKHACLILLAAAAAAAAAAPENYAPLLPQARPRPLRALTAARNWSREATATNGYEATRQYLIPDGGLTAYRTDNLLLLSDGAGGFRLWAYETFGIATNDFAALSADGPCCVMISQHLMTDAPGGKTHSYWVFAPYRIAGPALTPLTSAEWPMWTWYTIKPNHEPTKDLSRTEQERLWNARLQTAPILRELRLKRL